MATADALLLQYGNYKGSMLTTPSKQALKRLELCPAFDGFRQGLRSFFTVENLKRRLPLITWLATYTEHDILHDALAGITLGLTIIPQAIVFASVANVPLQYGLYSSIMGCFIYCLFGTVREMSIGPSAVMGLLIAHYSLKGGPAYTVLLCFLSGCIEFLFGFLNLGFLIDFISAPVSCGFSSAAAIMITATQLRSVLGLTVTAENFFDGIYKTATHIHETKYPDLIVGVSCMVVLLSLRYLNTIKWMDPGPNPTKFQSFSRRVVTFICTGRNALTVVLSSVVGYYLIKKDVAELTMTGDVKEGLPQFALPQFTITHDNHTSTFLDICCDLGAGLFLVPLLSILQHLVVAKIFIAGKTLDTRQEIIALGLTNILGSFVSALPTTGNLPRTALNAHSGVRSPLGGIFTGCMVLLALGLLTSYFKYIPRASLAAIIICAVIFMIKYDIVPYLWKTKKIDLLVMTVTFIGCIVVGADYGILFGIGVSLAVLLYNSARPNIVIQKSSSNGEMEYVLVQPDRMLSFPAVEYVRYKVTKISCGTGSTKLPVIFDGSHLCGMDFTIAQCIKEMTEEFKKRNQTLIFTHLHIENFKGSQFTCDSLHFKHTGTERNINICPGDNPVQLQLPDLSTSATKKEVIDVIKGVEPSSFIYYNSTKEAERALSGKGIVLPPGVSPISTVCDRLKTNHIDLRTLGSESSHPFEYTAAWLNLTDFLVSIPRVKLVRDGVETEVNS